jgi:D-alanyl-D-alanine carboxypeptidase
VFSVWAFSWVASACASAALTPLPATPVAAGTSAAGTSTSRSAVARSIDSLFDQPVFRTASWGALVLGPDGDTLYARNAAKLMTPASNMKVITGAVALAQLGPDFRFRDTAVALPLRDTVPRDFGPMYDTMMVRNATLREVLPKMLKPSQNRLAEQLFYTMALERTGVVSRDSAAAIERQQLTAWAIPSDGYIIRDGSGYERADFLSPETITRVLDVMRGDSSFAIWYDAFPIAGVDGTLVNRMRATLAERNVRAKTGSLGAVRALSGYVTTAGGAQLTFSIICNGFTTPSEVVTGTMDRAVTLLAALPIAR